ncbi:glucanase B [Gaeumannomyces tritici R3-111a-1]|uniref:Glucanase B n=1 Tax=Gaeumannomyces tritici (strain R3-111a-1) TaxID=644352 RepID=J3NPK3_GAET3|nr:glucanase B [Gaeumannomyces tritici R3-111a-1]EJT78108.1 glucanase B [Gaeumannomyces tritici R3-111a-1]
MPQSLDIQLRNESNSGDIFAYITGLALQRNSARVLLKSDGRGLYYPENPPKLLVPLAEDCAIPLGPPGNVVTVHIPQMAGGRIWFSSGGKLKFLLNPSPAGAALVEPSVLNPSDPNANIDFAFAELTLNNDQLFANISYVDFVPRLPIALALEEPGGGLQQVAGMASDGLEQVCAKLRAQAEKDKMPWDKLIVQKKGQPPLRALSPTHGRGVGARFDGYFEPLVEEVWRKYHCNHGGCSLKIDTQAAPGVLPGAIEGTNELVIGGEKFGKPTTADILGCNSGPFATGPSARRNAIIPRLAAAFSRGSIVDAEEHPSHPSTFYQQGPANHYSRIVHEVTLDGKGYGFAYDDVQPSGGDDQSGKVNAGNPKAFIVSVGGFAA